MSLSDTTVAKDARMPYLFVVGCPRSGTTLLQRMLNHHPLLTVAYDTHFIPRAIRRHPVGEDPPMTPETLAAVVSHPRFYRLELEPEVVRRAAGGSVTYSQFVEKIYQELAARHGKPLAGEKSPGYCRHLPRLHSLFPWARTIHLIRDGRDVTLSVLDWGKGQPPRIELWKREPVATCALWWRWKVATGRTDGSRLPAGHYCNLNYERLVARPEESMRTVCDFLGLPFSASTLEYHRGRIRQQKGLSAKAAWLPPTPGLRDWSTQMPERDVELFESLAGDLLAFAGYPLRTTAISASIRTLADECREWWQRHFDPAGLIPLPATRSQEADCHAAVQASR